MVMRAPSLRPSVMANDDSACARVDGSSRSASVECFRSQSAPGAAVAWHG